MIRHIDHWLSPRLQVLVAGALLSLLAFGAISSSQAASAAALDYTPFAKCTTGAGEATYLVRTGWVNTSDRSKAVYTSTQWQPITGVGRSPVAEIDGSEYKGSTTYDTATVSGFAPAISGSASFAASMPWIPNPHTSSSSTSDAASARVSLYDSQGRLICSARTVLH